MTIHRANYAVKGPNCHTASTEAKFFNSLDINYLRLIHFLWQEPKALNERQVRVPSGRRLRRRLNNNPYAVPC
jgi:hypothetical protein